ncbi:putative ATP-dependent RNA helicase DDX52 [Melipona quadrifasciata]|uniref:Probable ATP-dependent RNA helicase DDX52 n=1 Tax=Melipona quadrifasciata TaxID=166423 RepID=A0A0M9A6Y3_9HYME|nr:putative ATP-dependent RNA helicase DDX52 [Melipona quadrifasciata]
MDAYELFRKLSTGVKFDKKRFQVDAKRFQLVNRQPENELNDKKLDTEVFNSINHSTLREKRKHDDIEKETNNVNEPILLEGMPVSKNQNKRCKVSLTEEKRLKLEKEKTNQLRNQHRISVTGNRIPKPITEFTELSMTYGVSSKLINNIINCGYKCPTPIQMQAIPAMLQGRQILACAPTGSGKTAAFLVPIIHHLGGPKKKGFRAVILSPTRELAKQTYRECLRLSEGYDFRVHIISKINQALNKYGPKSSQKFDILITTPKRLIYLLTQDPPAISFSNVEWLIVDEVDKLFEDGTRCFRNQLETILKSCTNENLHKGMFSATNTSVVSKWCRHNLKEILFKRYYTYLLIYILITFKGVLPPVLIFVQSKERAQELFNELIYDGVNVDVIHADRTQMQRDSVVRCFREGKIWFLICTELMARGIDFKGVNLVINYDFPPSAISYVHRIGRTGRAGHRGKAITFFTEQDTINLRSIATIMRESGCNVPDYMLSMKKYNKKRKQEHKTPVRAKISTVPTFKRDRRKMRKNITKEKKQELKSEERKDKEINKE